MKHNRIQIECFTEFLCYESVSAMSFVYPHICNHDLDLPAWETQKYANIKFKSTCLHRGVGTYMLSQEIPKHGSPFFIQKIPNYAWVSF